MKTKYPGIFGILVAVMLVASFVVPTNMISPAPVGADPGVCKWDALSTPGYLPLKNDLGGALGYDIHDMAVGGDSATVLLVAQYYLPGIVLPPQLPPEGTLTNNLYYTNNNGISFTGTKNTAFQQEYFDFFNIPKAMYTAAGGSALYPNVYSVAIAPDNPSFWAISTSDNVNGAGPVEVWITSNSGGKWENTQISGVLAGEGETIRDISISVDYGGKRDIAIATVDGAGTGDIYVVSSTGFGGWRDQGFDLVPLGDFYALEFSPTYASDAALALVYASINGTFYNISLRDIDDNTHHSWPFAPVQLPPNSMLTTQSATIAELNKVDIELPSDFSGQAASLRRAYISLDTYNAGAAKAAWDGILRIDNTTVYILMDTETEPAKSIYSIAYFGTYASGKLLAGERMGWPCTAEAMTWFTDSPTTCPIPCWYPALKPTTGAAGIACNDQQVGIAGTLVGWRADGQLGFAATGSHAINTGAAWFGTGAPFNTSWQPWWTNLAVAPYFMLGNGSLFKNDESAFGISRNNGETWNQIALIDTQIIRFTDVAPTPDCKTIYLASVNSGFEGLGECYGFDSVWRTSSNIDVVSPYPPLPIGVFWERIYTHVTAPDCNEPQTNFALLRIVPYCADPTGEIVAWGVYDTNQDYDNGVAAWSPDFGDYWALVTPRDPIQDFTFESRTVMYFLNPDGGVQKMPYTGTAWATTLPTYDTIIYGAHTIAAYPEGKVVVGADAIYHANLYATSYSSNFNTDSPSFTVMSTAGATNARGNVHVAFDPNFADTSMLFIGDEDQGNGSVYRNNPAAQLRWGDTNMLSAANGAVGCPNPREDGIFGVVLAFTGEALYAASSDGDQEVPECGVWRTIDDGTGHFGPLSGMPKPGIAWDFLDVFVDAPARGPCFTLEPSSLKICGCCDLDSDSTLWAIDDAAYSTANRTGLVWAFTDCLAKRGPELITEDAILIGCDPVSGRAQEVNLCWEQLCVANSYDIEIAKNEDFSIRIIDWVSEADCIFFLDPVDVTIPCAFFPAGGAATFTQASQLAAWGNLECGHTYYWRVKARSCATQQIIRSPWSAIRSFTVKAGLPVTTPYYGPQLLAPNNGCLGCPVSPASFSWSPFKETSKYKFVLAKDAAMTQVVKEAEVTTTAFEYDGTLDYSTNYFWRVMALEPAPSDWSATFSFQTEAAPAEEPADKPPAPTPLWVWVVIAIGAILVIVTLVLIFKTRRV